MSKIDIFAAGFFVGVFAVIIAFAIIPSFSSPSSVATASNESAVVIISCLDLQVYLNLRDPYLNLKEDGICGPATMAAWDEAVNTQYALELWPEVK